MHLLGPKVWCVWHNAIVKVDTKLQCHVCFINPNTNIKHWEGQWRALRKAMAHLKNDDGRSIGRYVGSINKDIEHTPLMTTLQWCIESWSGLSLSLSLSLSLQPCVILIRSWVHSHLTPIQGNLMDDSY
jgi:hypothetical protein